MDGIYTHPGFDFPSIIFSGIPRIGLITDQCPKQSKLVMESLSALQYWCLQSQMYRTDEAWTYFQRSNLEALSGMKMEEIPLAVAKELIDNFLDAADRQGKDPEITVKYASSKTYDGKNENAAVVIQSNTQMSPEEIKKIYNSPFDTRISSKTYVKVPSRGIFGMASRMIQALPYALAMDLGLPLPKMPIEILTSYEGKKYIFGIGAKVDRDKRTASPSFNRLILGSSEGEYTEFSITLSKPAKGISDSMKSLVFHYWLLNPNLEITCRVDGESTKYKRRSSGRRSRGRPSVISYNANEFVEAARVQKDPYPYMSVLQFMTGFGMWPGFKGFSGRERSALLLRETGFSPSSLLSDLDEGELTKIHLIMVESANENAKMKPSFRDLNPTGRGMTDMIPGSIYRTFRGDKPGPWIMEATLIPVKESDGYPEEGPEVVVGVNGSPLLRNPFRAYNMQCRRKKWSSTVELLRHVNANVICVINMNGLIQPLSTNKSEIDSQIYFEGYKRLVCSIFDGLREKKKGARRKSAMIEWLRREIERRISIHRDDGAIPESEIASQQSLWYKARKWYSSENGGAEPDISREYFINSIRDICKQFNVSREYCGIFAAERAMVYFRGRRMGVSLESIGEVFRYGSDLICIEKEGICAVLESLAATYGIALMNSRGQLVDYAEELIRRAKDSGANVWLVTDLDDAGIIMRKNLLGIKCLGVDRAMVMALGEENGKSYGAFSKELQEEFTPRYTRTLDDDDFRQLGWDGKGDRNRLRRIEIDSVLAMVGRERFWGFLLRRMVSEAPHRDLTRSVFEDDIVDRSMPTLFRESIDVMMNAMRKRLRQRVDEDLSPYRRWGSGFEIIDKVETKVSDHVKGEEEKYTKLYAGVLRKAVREVKRALGSGKDP